MERQKSDILEQIDFADNTELLSAEKNISEKDLEIEVLNIDHFGILPDTEEENHENCSNFMKVHLNNDSSEKVSCSPAKSEGSTSLSSKTSVNSSSPVKSQVRLQIRNYKCHQCRFSTQNSRKYLYHLQDVHKQKFAIHECSNCEYASKHVKNLQRHFNLIHGEKTEDNPESSEQLPKKLYFSLPKKAKLQNIGKFQCTLCSFHTTSERILGAHVTCHDQAVNEENMEIADTNSEEGHAIGNGIDNQSDIYSSDVKVSLTDHLTSQTQKNLKCPLCKMNVRYISWLIRHLRNNHRGNVRAETLAAAYEKKKRRKRPNNVGLQNLRDRKTLKKPTNLHVTSSAYKCGQMKLDDFVSLSTVPTQSVSGNQKKIFHEKSHTDLDNAIRCKICYYKFKGLLEFQEHMQIHSTVSTSDSTTNSVKGKKCDTFNSVNHNAPIVPKVGKQSAILKNVRNRMGSKISNSQYKCPYCPFKINSVSRFHVHFVQHMKNLQFRCSDCDYHSSWKWTVVKHIWSKVRNKKNHFNASVLTNNELVDLNRFKLYKKYLVNQSKSVNYELNIPQENHSAWFQSVKSNILPNEGLHAVNFPIEITSSPSLSLDMPDSPREVKYYSCKECSFKNISKQIVINHLATHADIKPFQCSVCDFKSNWKHAIIRHMKNLHTGHNNIIEQKISFIQEGFVLCRESVFQNNDKSYMHPDVISQRIFSCRICPYTTNKKYHMNFHKNQHKYREGANYKCDICPYFVKFAKTLIKHKKLHSTLTNNVKRYLKVDNCAQKQSPKKYFRKMSLTCTVCPARFSQQDRFRRHLELHGKSYKFKCNHCDYSVQCAANLVKHKKLHEIKTNLESPDCPNSFSCSVCPAVFSLKNRYIRHLKFHNRNYSNQDVSSVQGSVNVIKDKKLQYIKQKSELLGGPKSLACPKCPTIFSSNEGYTRHLELHGQDYRFTCRYCDFSVQNAVNMQKHEKIHQINRNLDFQEPIYPENLNSIDTAEEPVALSEPVVSTNEKRLFICDRCPYYSGCKSAVQNHQRSHWFKQSFECSHCDYSALQRSSLQTHLKLHLEGSKLFPPHAFMKFQSFKIIVQEENGEKLVFDDETMLNDVKEKFEEKNDTCVIKDTTDIQNNSTKYFESKETDKNHCDDEMESVSASNSKSDKDPIVVLTDIFDKNPLSTEID